MQLFITIHNRNGLGGGGDDGGASDGATVQARLVDAVRFVVLGRLNMQFDKNARLRVGRGGDEFDRDFRRSYRYGSLCRQRCRASISRALT